MKEENKIPISFCTFFHEGHDKYLKGCIESVPAGSEHIIILTTPSEEHYITLLEEMDKKYGKVLPSIDKEFSQAYKRFTSKLGRSVNKRTDLVKLKEETLPNGTVVKMYQWFYYKTDLIDTFTFDNISNIIIRLAKRDWIFVLNADERVSMQTEEIEEVKKLPKNVGGVWVRLHHLKMPDIPSENDLGTVIAHPFIRLFRNNPIFKFIYRVHEQIYPAIKAYGFDVSTSNILIKHLGFNEKKTITDHSYRNISGLCKDIGESLIKKKSGKWQVDDFTLNRLFASLNHLNNEGLIKKMDESWRL